MDIAIKTSVSRSDVLVELFALDSVAGSKPAQTVNTAVRTKSWPHLRNSDLYWRRSLTTEISPHRKIPPRFFLCCLLPVGPLGLIQAIQPDFGPNVTVFDPSMSPAPFRTRWTRSLKFRRCPQASLIRCATHSSSSPASIASTRSSATTLRSPGWDYLLMM
jgi:hypothetical protein